MSRVLLGLHASELAAATPALNGPVGLNGLERVWKMLKLSQSALRPSLSFRVGTVPAAASGDRSRSVSIFPNTLLVQRGVRPRCTAPLRNSPRLP